MRSRAAQARIRNVSENQAMRKSPRAGRPMIGALRGLVAALVLSHPWGAVILAYVAGQLTAVLVLTFIPRDDGYPPPPLEPPRPRSDRGTSGHPKRSNRVTASRNGDEPPAAA